MLHLFPLFLFNSFPFLCLLRILFSFFFFLIHLIIIILYHLLDLFPLFTLLQFLSLFMSPSYLLFSFFSFFILYLIIIILYQSLDLFPFSLFSNSLPSLCPLRIFFFFFFLLPYSSYRQLFIYSPLCSSPIPFFVSFSPPFFPSLSFILSSLFFIICSIYFPPFVNNHLNRTSSGYAINQTP